MKLVEYRHLLVKFKKIKRIRRRIKKKIKSFIDNSNLSIKSKCLKHVVKKNTAIIIKMSRK